jgi:cobalt/nickel transport system ATP-binding protein
LSGKGLGVRFRIVDCSNCDLFRANYYTNHYVWRVGLALVHCAVDMQGVHFRYPDGRVALDGVNLQVGLHERAAILGANGAGKSTLLSVMCGVFEASKGTIKILDKEVTPKTIRELRASVGLVFQEPDNQLFMPTLWEDVAFGPLNLGLEKEEVIQRVEEALDVVGLAELRDQPPHHLSVGEKKRAAIATVLAMRPEILILDEPTAHLDPKSRADFIEFLMKLHKEGGLTLITATHDVDSVPLLAERAYILHQGRITARGTVTEVFSNMDVLSEARLSPPTVTQLFQQLHQLTGKSINPNLPMTISEAIQVLREYVGLDGPAKSARARQDRAQLSTKP